MRRVFALVALSMMPAAATAADQVPVVTPQIPPAQVAPPTADDILALGADQPGRLTVPVTIGMDGPYPFTIDTGAERTVISRELAMRLRLTPGPSVRLTAMSGASDVKTVIIPALTVSTAGTTRIEAPLLSGENLGAVGLLGIDTLKNHAVTIDFDTNRMTVRPSEKRSRHRKPEPGEIVVRAKSLLGQLVVTDADYRGQRVRVILDTGSVVTLGNMALGRRAAHDKGPTQQISMVSVIGGQMAANYTQISKIRIGDIAIKNLPIAFTDAPPFERFGLTDQPALLLGMDALRQFRRVEIDFANREVRFTFPRDPS